MDGVLQTKSRSNDSDALAVQEKLKTRNTSKCGTDNGVDVAGCLGGVMTSIC